LVHISSDDLQTSVHACTKALQSIR
jgi:hypothetical protein